MRCGRCRSAFDARLMSVEAEEDLNTQQERRSNGAQTKDQDEGISDNTYSQIVSRSDIAKLVTPERNNNWDKPYANNVIQRESDNPEVIRPDTDSPLFRDSESIADDPVTDDPNETPALEQKSDRLFSEAMDAIDDTPDFNLDDYTGSDLIEEEFGRAQPETRSVSLNEEPSAVYEEPSAVYEEPSAQHEEPSANREEPSASEEEPSASEERSAETSNDSFTITSSNGEQLLADAFSVIDNTPDFNIEDYHESTLDITGSVPWEAEDEHLASESSTHTIETHADQLLGDALSVINDSPSFKTEDYRESTIDYVESTDNQTQDDIVSKEGMSAPNEEVIETNDDSRLAEALKVIEESPSFQMTDYTDIEEAQAELFDVDTPDSSQFSEPASDQVSELDTPSEENDQTLITEVDQLIEEKLVIDSIAADESDTIDFSNTTKHSALNRWVYGPLLGLVALVLIAVLGYQLWLKQATPLLESPQLATVLEPVISPLKQQLQKYAVTLPERRNLNQLELLSARTEAHPTRSSTILLRASLINRAKISQPFPWLELSLTDEDGRLVSRRAISPKDYLHNNRTENRINANELKQVTIELLAFPKQAHGFELRLLNK